MAKKRRKASFGSSHEKHTLDAAREAGRAYSLALESARAVDTGRCGTALTALLGARGSAAAATAHVASGGGEPVTRFHQTVERAVNHFASRCVRKS